MKNTLPALFIALSAVAMPSEAQEIKTVTGKVRCSKNIELTLPEGTEYTMYDYGTTKTLSPEIMRKAEGETEKEMVNVKITCSKKPNKGKIFNKGFSQKIKFNGKEASVSIPKGTYDLLVYFVSDARRYVIKEDIVIGDNVKSGEEMNIEVNDDESTIPVEFHYYDENKRELFLDIYDGRTLDTQGTADDITKFSSILHKDYGPVESIISFGARAKSNPEDFYINKVSDKYYIGQAAGINVGPHYYIYKIAVSDFNNTIYNSNPASLAKLVTSFINSPKMPTHEYVGLSGVDFSLLNDGNQLANVRTWTEKKDPADNGKSVIYIDCPETKTTEKYCINTAVCPIFTDSYEVIKYPGSDEEEDDFTFITAPYAIGDANDGVVYLVSGTDKDTGFNAPVGETNFRYYPGHPEFSFAAPDGTAHFGNSVPVMVYSSMKIKNGPSIKAYDTYRYLGRYGEIRETDSKFAKVVREDSADGIHVMITNENVEVDGVAGKNVTEILFDMKKNDKTAPTFQMLTFKDAEGNICDRFASPQGARMLVAGGDFSYVDNNEAPYVGYFTCDAPASVKASCAPHGTETWHELTLVEDPSKFFMPAFGHFYEADLSGVKAEDKDVWFDVRLELTDMAGNYQKQTLSPAFKVNSSVNAVETISTDADKAFLVIGKKVMIVGGEKANITVCSVDGRMLQNTYADSVDLSGMGNGIYVVTAVTATGKVISTKVTL